MPRKRLHVQSCTTRHVQQAEFSAITSSFRYCLAFISGKSTNTTTTHLYFALPVERLGSNVRA